MTIHWPSHPHVPHPAHMLQAERSRVRAASTWAAEHLALVFGATTTVWVFLITPLAILLFPKNFQDVVFYLASGWVQLFALPLLTFVANKSALLQSTKADADHQALASVHITVDDVKRINAVQDERLARIEAHLGVTAPAKDGV